MNLNAIRTALTAVTAALVAVMGFAPQILGCTVDMVSNAVSCVNSWLPPAWVGTVATALLLANLALKLLQGGTINIGAWFKPTAVISNSGNPGTVAPQDVVKK